MSLWNQIKRLFGGAPEPAPESTPSAAEPGAPAKAPSTREELFTAEVERALVATGAKVVRRLPDEFGIVAKRGDSEFTIYLGNTFRETRDVDPAERQRRIAILVGIFPGVEGTIAWEEAAPRLVPILRPATAFLAVTSRAGALPVFHRPAAPMLLEAIAIDSPQSMQMLTRDLAQKWGVSDDEIFARARANLAAAAVAMAPYDPEAPYPIFVVTNDDSYESSRLLLPGFLASFAGRVNGRPIAIAPDRAMLVVGGDGDPACIERMLGTAERQWSSSPRSISPALYGVDETGALVPYHAPAGHPLAPAIELAHVKLALHEYEHQKPILQQKLGDDVFVASFSAVKTDTGELFSYCTWTRSVPSVLPRTDFVMLFDDQAEHPGPDPKTDRVPWAQVAAHLTELPGEDPPRFRTGAWPESR